MTKSRRRSLFIEFAKPRPPGKPGEGPVTTMMVGEEKDGSGPGPVTTMRVGEEGDSK